MHSEHLVNGLACLGITMARIVSNRSVERVLVRPFSHYLTGNKDDGRAPSSRMDVLADGSNLPFACLPVSCTCIALVN